MLGDALSLTIKVVLANQYNPDCPRPHVLIGESGICERPSPTSPQLNVDIEWTIAFSFLEMELLCTV